MSGLNPKPTTPQNETQNETAEAFPALNEPSSPATPKTPKTPASNNESATANRSRDSTLSGRLRSVSKSFQESSPPVGFCVATGEIASSLPSVTDIREGAFRSDGWSGEGQVIERQRRASLSTRGSLQFGESNNPRANQVRHESVPECAEDAEGLGIIKSGVPLPIENTPSGPSSSNQIEIDTLAQQQTRPDQRSSSDTNLSPNTSAAKVDNAHTTTPFDNGYQFPPKHKWTKSTAIGLKAFWGFFLTPVGFLVTVYGLNVVAWGGMLFLLLCNASPSMCKPSCGDINSPRRIWIEIDSQILNALFCVTGFGTIPWRFRDLYYLMQYRIQKKEIGLRRLAGINSGWFRLAGSEDLPVEVGKANIETKASDVPESSIPFPITKTPNAPLTGVRAPPTKMWKLDFVVWTMVWNTFLQAVLSGFMWGLNRYNRPSWSTGLFVAMACIVAGCGGIMSFVEGKHVKAIEGVPVSVEDQEQLKQDRELGITHFNNINDAPPKEKKEKKEKSKKAIFHNKQNSEPANLEQSALKEGAAQIVK